MHFCLRRSQGSKENPNLIQEKSIVIQEEIKVQEEEEPTIVQEEVEEENKKEVESKSTLKVVLLMCLKSTRVLSIVSTWELR